MSDTFTLVLDRENVRALHKACAQRAEYLKLKLAEAERNASAEPFKLTAGHNAAIAEINFELEISRTLCAHLSKLEPDAA